MERSGILGVCSGRRLGNASPRPPPFRRAGRIPSKTIATPRSTLNLCQAPSAKNKFPRPPKSFFLCSLFSDLCCPKFADYFAIFAILIDEGDFHGRLAHFKPRGREVWPAPVKRRRPQTARGSDF